MDFIPLGDTDDVAASCHYLDIAGSGLVLDAGVDDREADARAVVIAQRIQDGLHIKHVVPPEKGVGSRSLAWVPHNLLQQAVCEHLVPCRYQLAHRCLQQ